MARRICLPCRFALVLLVVAAAGGLRGSAGELPPVLSRRPVVSSEPQIYAVPRAAGQQQAEPPDAQPFAVSFPGRPGILAALFHLQVEFHFGSGELQSGSPDAVQQPAPGLCLAPPQPAIPTEPSLPHEASRPVRNWVMPGRSFGGLVDDLPVRRDVAADAPRPAAADESDGDLDDPVQLRPGEPAEVALDIRRRVGSVLAGSVFALDNEHVDDREFVRSFRLAAYESEAADPAPGFSEPHAGTHLVPQPQTTHDHAAVAQPPSLAPAVCAACGRSPMASSVPTLHGHVVHQSANPHRAAVTTVVRAPWPHAVAAGVPQSAAVEGQHSHSLAWPGSAGQQPLDAQSIESLRRSAEQLEQTANLLERQGQYERADDLRIVAQRLRLDARQAACQAAAGVH